MKRRQKGDRETPRVAFEENGQNQADEEVAETDVDLSSDLFMSAVGRERYTKDLTISSARQWTKLGTQGRGRKTYEMTAVALAVKVAGAAATAEEDELATVAVAAQTGAVLIQVEGKEEKGW